MTQPTILDRLLCSRCGEMLEDAQTLSDGRRACLACVCHACSDDVYRFVDKDNDDLHLCETCTAAEITRKMVSR